HVSSTPSCPLGNSSFWALPDLDSERRKHTEWMETENSAQSVASAYFDAWKANEIERARPLLHVDVVFAVVLGKSLGGSTAPLRSAFPARPSPTTRGRCCYSLLQPLAISGQHVCRERGGECGQARREGS